MGSYITSIKYSFLFFPFLAFIFTLPYMMYQYRKYGSILFLRVVIVYSFILYCTTAYFLVIFPLPSFSEVAKLNLKYAQLEPFAFIKDFIANSGIVFSDPSTYLKAMKSSIFYQAAYNVVLMIPFGIYLHYYFECGWFKTTIITFMVSFFFEFTQLTGLYGIYPRNYRIFDVDDLILNTLGGVIGFIITPLLTGFLPSKEKLDKTSYIKGQQISFMRRTLAFLIDLLICIVIHFSLKAFIPYTHWSMTLILYFLIYPMITKGRTIGMRVLRFKVVSKKDKTPKFYHYIVRYGILYGIALAAPYYMLVIIRVLEAKRYSNIYFVIADFLFFFSVTVIFCIDLFNLIFNGGGDLLYERLSLTKLKSTIDASEFVEDNDNN